MEADGYQRYPKVGPMHTIIFMEAVINVFEKNDGNENPRRFNVVRRYGAIQGFLWPY